MALIRATSKNSASDDGLLQRFQLAVWPDVKGEWRNVDRPPNNAAKELAYSNFQRMANLGGAPDGDIPFRRFDTEAQAVFDEWRESLESEFCSGDLSPALEGHFAKYRSLAPSLALICSVADDEEADAVGAESTLRAISWAGYLRTHAERIWSSAVSPEISAGIALAKHILKGDLGKEFPLRDVQRKRWAGLADRAHIEAAMSFLIDLDWLRSETKPTATKTVTVYHVNLKLKAQTHGV